ncbi:MAG: hypothetical protein GY909_13665 [Oligoflexia bacterium]|nr:hypothetical protein [Oligoflexia bacterium]
MNSLIPIFIFLLLLNSCFEKETDTPKTTSPVPTNCDSGGFFVDSVSGSDSNAGTTSCVPFKTISKLQSSITNGTTAYLKRGSSWNESLSFANSNITITAYGSGSLPVFFGDEAISSWTNEGGNIYSKIMTLGTGEGLGNISKDGSMLSFVAWNSDFTTTLGAAANDSFSYNNSAKTLYIKSTNDPSSFSYRYSKLMTGISVSSASNVNISYIKVKGYSFHGVEFKNCTNCNISNSELTQIGGATIGSLYAGNGVEYGSTSSSGTASSLTISEIFDSCFSPQTYSSNQTITGITIKDSTLSKCGFAGVEISVLSNGGTTGSTISNTTVENVTISDCGKGWSGRRYNTEGHGIRVQADNTAGVITNTQIKRVTVSNSAGDGIKVNGDTSTTTIHRAKIYNGSGYGINFLDTVKTTPKLVLTSSLIHNNSNYGLTFNCPSCQGLNIYQNTFYKNTTINLAIFGQSNEAIIKNNIFHSDGAMTDVFVNSTLVGGNVNYNCYEDGTNMIGYNSSTYSTVTAFNGAQSFEANGTGAGNINMTNPSSGAFTLLTTSSCKTLGDNTVSVTEDYFGSTFSNPPSSGAHQF